MMEDSYKVWSSIYQVGGPGLSHSEDCCVYAVDCGDEIALIDAGSGRGLKKILQHLKKLFFEKELTTVFATHGHIDHIGGLVYLKEKLDLKNIVAHKDDSQIIAHGDPEATASKMCGLYYRGVQPTTVLKKDKKIKVGNIDFTCVHTPGHTPGSISILLETGGKKILFGQDIHGPFDAIWGSELSKWKESMLQLLEIDADILCEGHAGVIQGKQKVQQFINSYLQKYGM